jgi:hypothetical protein
MNETSRDRADEPARPELSAYADDVAGAEMIIRNNGW